MLVRMLAHVTLALVSLALDVKWTLIATNPWDSLVGPGNKSILCGVVIALLLIVLPGAQGDPTASISICETKAVLATRTVWREKDVETANVSESVA